MRTHSWSHLSDTELLQELGKVHFAGGVRPAPLLAYIAEAEIRMLYSQQGNCSMFCYCVGRLHMPEEQACQYLLAADTARRFPEIFDAVAAGRVNVDAVDAMHHHLTPENVESLLAAVAGMNVYEVHRELDLRFPRQRSGEV